MSRGPEANFLENARNALSKRGVKNDKFIGNAYIRDVPDLSLEFGDYFRWVEIKAEAYESLDYHPGTKVPVIGSSLSAGQHTELVRKSTMNPQPNHVASLIVTDVHFKDQQRHIITFVLADHKPPRLFSGSPTVWKQTAAYLLTLQEGEYRISRELGVVQAAYNPGRVADFPMPVWPFLKSWWDSRCDIWQYPKYVEAIPVEKREIIWTRKA